MYITLGLGDISASTLLSFGPALPAILEPRATLIVLGPG
jgi:hypothetical protein